ncbi:MAG: hypothetical protein AAGA56_17890 [Myxococcota bacterium]
MTWRSGVAQPRGPTAIICLLDALGQRYDIPELSFLAATVTACRRNGPRIAAGSYVRTFGARTSEFMTLGPY